MIAKSCMVLSASYINDDNIRDDLHTTQVFIELLRESSSSNYQLAAPSLFEPYKVALVIILNLHISASCIGVNEV